MKKALPVLFNCSACPAYCCTYPRIVVTDRDIARLARRFDISKEKARKRFTKKGEEKGERVLRHREDEIFGTACRFLDLETRACTVYEHRPRICREFPGGRRCGYYDFLCFERRAQDDPSLAITAWIANT